MRTATTVGTVAARAAGALVPFRLADEMTGRGQGRQAKPT